MKKRRAVTRSWDVLRLSRWSSETHVPLADCFPCQCHQPAYCVIIAYCVLRIVSIFGRVPMLYKLLCIMHVQNPHRDPGCLCT